MGYVSQNIEKYKKFDGATLISCLDRPGAMYYGSQTTPTLVLRCHAFRTQDSAFSGEVSWDLYMIRSIYSPSGQL